MMSVYGCVDIATREISERADNRGGEEKATVRKTTAKKEGADWLLHKRRAVWYLYWNVRDEMIQQPCFGDDFTDVFHAGLL